MVAAVMGWLGTAGTFLAYALLCRGRLTSQSRRYAALNAAGGLLGGTACVIYGAWPSAASNLAWAALGLHSLLQAYRVVRADRGGPHPHTPEPASCARLALSGRVSGEEGALSHEEQRRLDGMAQLLQEEDPHFTQRFDLATAQQRLQRHAEVRILLLVLIGAIALSVGVAAIIVFDVSAGTLVAALGCAVLVLAVRTARRNPPCQIAGFDGT